LEEYILTASKRSSRNANTLNPFDEIKRMQEDIDQGMKILSNPEYHLFFD
jgi:hypothetical protein